MLMLFLDGACQSSGFLKIVYFVLNLVNIVFFIVPVGLIVMISVDFVKNVLADLDTMSKNLKVTIRRILYCVVVFFIPTIVNIFVGILSDAGIKLGYAECIANAKIDIIKDLEKSEKLKKKETYVPETPKDKVSNRKIVNSKKKKKKNESIDDSDSQNDSTPVISIKIDKSSLSSGGSANVVVKVKNANKKKDFLNAKVAVSLPDSLTTSGKISKKVNKLSPGKKMTLSFKIKANKKVKFEKSANIKDSNEGSISIYKLKKPVSGGDNITVTLKEVTAPDNYGDSMISLLSSMNSFAKSRNSHFAMITNGGYELYIPGKVVSSNATNSLMSSMDGMLVEDVFYGEDGENSKTDSGDTKIMKKAIKSAQGGGLKTFVLDYCNRDSCKSKIKKGAKALGAAYYVAPSKELEVLPKLASSRVNSGDCNKLSQVKNFAIVLNPDIDYSSKSSYLSAIKKSNYDLIFIDMYFSGNKLSKSDVSSLKKKANGGRRYICGYVSVGEAEDYRYYWKSSYKKSQPLWMATENKEWEGNYKVLYWTKQWKDILYGGDNSYFGQILDLGFDCSYLDVIDAYEFFKNDYK